MLWIIQIRTGDFVAANGGFTEYASEALAFDCEKDAVHASFRWLGAKIIRMTQQFSGYESSTLREHENFVNHIHGVK